MEDRVKVYANVWEELRDKLPVDLDPDSKEKRARLFRQFDPNGNGLLSLAEVDAGLEKVLRCEDLFNAKRVTLRAFQAAKDVNKRSETENGGVIK